VPDVRFKRGLMEVAVYQRRRSLESAGLSKKYLANILPKSQPIK